MQIGLFGDDYFYATFFGENFLELHKQHYLESNGRIIVHLLDSIFLALPRFTWSILNSLMLTGIAYFGSKILTLFSDKKNVLIKSIIIFIFGTLILDISITRQSVYWITGSFNYVYPIFLLFWYWYVLLKNSKTNFEGKKLLTTSLLAFFTSATVEQGALMTFGLTVLFFLYNLINNKKNNTTHNLKRLSIILLCSFIGMISVICSPAQFVRYEIETKEAYSIVDSLDKNIDFMIDIFTKQYLPHVMLLIFSLVAILVAKKSSEKFNNDQINLIITTIILGIGSQAMMLVSPVYGERNTLFGIYMIIFFTAIIISKLPEYNRKTFKYFSRIFYLSLTIYAIIYSTNNFTNYRITDQIQNENIKLIDEYKKSNSGDSLELYTFTDDRYGWSMPYVSKYHEYWFKTYYDIPNTEIIWHEYKNK